MEVPAKADPALDDAWLRYAREHSLRAQMLALVAQQPLSLAELSETLDQPPTLVAYHWRVLEMAGLL